MSQLTAVFIAVACMTASPDETLQQVHRFMAADRVEAAEELLRKELKNHPDNGRLRHTLARILAYDGRVDEAIGLLKEGVTDDANDVTKLNLLMLAGELSLSRAKDGPTVTRRRGTVSYRPEKPGDDKTAFVEKHAAVAEASFRQAMKIAPKNPHVVRNLARTLTLVEKSEAAMELWSKRLEQAPKDREATVQLASLRFKVQQADAAIALLKDGLKDRPNDSEMLKLMLQHYEAINNEKEIPYWKRRHQFSKRIPSFVHLEYSEENLARIESLATE